MAGNNIKAEADGKIYTINHAGVALHPGDDGMKVYADRLHDAVCQYERERESATKANNVQSSNQLIGGNMKLDENKILFVVQKQSEDNYTACIQSIYDLKIPEGKEIEICTWTPNKTGLLYSRFYNAVIDKNNAKYKIYLPDTTCFVSESALLELLKIMESDYEIGMLGVCGAKSLPVSGIWQEAEHKIGRLYALQADGNVSEIKYDEPEEEYEEVQSISSVIVATQYDLPWRDAANGDLCATAQSLEFIRQGYKAVVPAQAQAWCLSMAGEKNNLQVDGIINEYAGYLLSDGLAMSDEAMLRRFGVNAVLGVDCKLLNPAKISIGDDVAIGDNCCFAANEQIDIEHDVIIENKVYLNDRQIEILDHVPVFGGGFEEISTGRLLVGHHSHIEPNVQLQGGISIGCGCLIKANSVVGMDIPNHCVAAGNPARVIQAMDYEDGKWVAINSDVELEQLLEKRRNAKPILTIGIPTYNRLYYLCKCLRHIYKQVGNDDIVEILVSDNHSEDNTRNIVSGYSDKYSNLTYNRNEVNVGVENFVVVWQKANGRYVLTLGDDDYLHKDAVYTIIRSLYENKSISILSLYGKAQDKYTLCKGNGINDFVSKVSYVSTYIASIVFNTQYYRQLKDKKKYANTSLNQVYIQLQMIVEHPDFAVLYGPFYTYNTGEANFDKKYPLQKKSNLASVFIAKYFDMLDTFTGDEVGKLTEETIRQDKKHVMEEFFLPWCHIVTHNDNCWKIDDNVEEIIQKYYGNEPYYDFIMEKINEYLQIQKKLNDN